jgi:hypothetical protein
MKDAYYFSHDSNAKDDPKCVMLIETLQLEGYGIFWMLVETLRDQPNYRYPLILIPALARRYNTTPEKVKSVITKFGLFQIENDEFFYSDSLNKRMELRESIRQKRVSAGIKSGEKRRQKALEYKPEHMFNKCSTHIEQGKERKGKERKEKGKRNIYGEYKHVLLTDKQHEDLKDKVDNREKWIKIVDESIEEKGNVYKIKNFYLAILKWYRKENPEKTSRQSIILPICPLCGKEYVGHECNCKWEK